MIRKGKQWTPEQIHRRARIRILLRQIPQSLRMMPGPVGMGAIVVSAILEKTSMIALREVKHELS
jgi:hypothetical protein